MRGTDSYIHRSRCDSSTQWMSCSVFFFFQAEDGIRDLVRSRGLGDVYKRQLIGGPDAIWHRHHQPEQTSDNQNNREQQRRQHQACLLYTSDAADERSSVDLGGRRIIKKKKTSNDRDGHELNKNKTCREITSRSQNTDQSSCRAIK